MADFTVYTNIVEPFEADEDALATAALSALQVSGAVPPAALSIIITSSEEVHNLNLEYAGIDEPTDVLSFSPEDEPYNTDPDDPPYLGDVIIAYPVAEEQAGEKGVATISELQLLAIHGTLHLLGYDHDTPENQAEMWALQSAAMDAIRSGY